MVGGLPVATVSTTRGFVLGPAPTQAPTSKASTDRYWSTPARALGDPAREVLEVAFNDQRLVNYVSVELPRFPHQATLEYLDVDTGAWRPVLRRDSTVPATYAVGDSAPAVVNTAVPAGEHPQHRGAGHWLPLSFRVKPFLARRVRLLMSRSVVGSAPVDVAGNRVPYSLGARVLQVGYRINSLADVPRYGEVTSYVDDFASSTDLLGSRVSFSLVQDSPSAVLGGSESDLWRSEPMPVNYAVVNFYADTRGPDGDGQVIDRWYMEPLTTGPAVNLYWSNGAPSGPVPASDEALNYPVVQFHGTSATAQKYPPTLTPEHISFSHVFPSYIDVDNSHVQFDPTRPWWLAVEVSSPYYGADGVSEIPEAGDSHPIVSFGASTLRSIPNAVEFTSSAGTVLTVPMDPEHGRGSRWQAVVSWDGAVLSLTYALSGHDPVTSQAVAPPPARPALIRLGGYPNSADPGVPGLVMRALVLKSVAPDPDDVARFLGDARAYTNRPPFADDDDGSTDDSILRLDPPRANPALSPAGLYGGPGDPYESLEWTPVLRDYALRQGYMYLPPTKARYWKFEITNLVAEPYQTFVPVAHLVKTFTTAVTKTFAAAGYGTGTPAGGSGTTGMSVLGPLVPYRGATVLQRSAAALPNQHSATEALVARGPAETRRVADYGWVWGFQALHPPATAPRFTTKTRHVYETVQITQQNKVAYFAGLRRLQPYRLDYEVDDDADQYLDHLDDLHWVSGVMDMDLDDGALVALSEGSSATSVVLASKTPVRALQFATQQTDPVQVLPDDQFTDVERFADYWSAYGDADLRPEFARVLVNRGWRPETWGEVEVREPTYGDLEVESWADLEGSTPESGAGGGVQSAPVSTSASGQVYAAARVSAADALSAPVVLQIVDADSGVVLAQDQAPALAAGEEAVLVATYALGTAADRLTYSAIEDATAHTWGDAEAQTYGQHESTAVLGDVIVRVLQLAPSSDVFSVIRLSLFDDPIEWDFSVDGGGTWYAARGVRNNTSGVLSLPQAGTGLCWRVRASRAGASVSAIAIRPWYVGAGRCRPGHPGGRAAGPNRTPADHYPDIGRDPLWMGWSSPIPRSWYTAVASAVPAPTDPGLPTPPPSGGADVYGDTYPTVYGGSAISGLYVDTYYDTYA